MKKLFISLSSMLIFSGCVVHPPVVEAPRVEVPAVSIEPPVQVITPAPVITPVPVQPVPRYYDYHYRDKYKHHRHKHRHHRYKRRHHRYKDCPPGLRMQGRC